MLPVLREPALAEASLKVAFDLGEKPFAEFFTWVHRNGSGTRPAAYADVRTLLPNLDTAERSEKAEQVTCRGGHSLARRVKVSS
jgi:hypothetical protein